MTKFTDHTDQPDIDSAPSKSQLKRNMKEFQELAKKLVDAPLDLLKKINMEEVLSNAVLLARRLGKNSSKRRQLQYIGRLLSQTDTDAIKQLLNTYNLQQQNSNNAFHDIEKWRDKLIREGNAALNELIEKHQNLDRQHLWQLIRNAQKEESQQKPPTSSRAIFSYLKDNIEYDS